MSDKGYDEQRKQEKLVTKQLALSDLREWKNKLPKDKLTQPAIVVGTKTFTPQEIEKEVEEDTEYGQAFAKILAKSKLELTKGGKNQ
ncbi:MAG: hypothetical protein NWE93_11775 [Candidatus Bathyarchaeota archaeon]|nr:hypothetical protein [Candidatus Bathyarchaeota archaeon]